LINAGLYSTYIYLYHPLVITVYSGALSVLGITNRPLPYLEPFFICIMTTVFAVICVKLQKRKA
jgi:peptidoglycan/LPS O-acetylase OafA/YrhL